jgi:hypothetical protein
MATGQGGSHRRSRGGSDDRGDNHFDDAAMLGELLEDLVPALVRKCVDGQGSEVELRGLRQLAEQSIRMGIDYAGLGLGWYEHPEFRTRHPESRTRYRLAQDNSTTCEKSRTRAEKSKASLTKYLELVIAGTWTAEKAIVAAFCDEISACPAARQAATGEGVLAALEAELLLPLRALNEDRLSGASMACTFHGDELPRKKIETCVDTITLHVLDGSFSEWRYSNPIGQRQLEGLTDEQKTVWSETTRTEAGDGLVVHEDATGELGFFWATKIGGPSHGFDIEGQCLLPLLANARHKVVLVSDPQWPHHPCGRAHFRLLWTNTSPQRPVLWLETLNTCFDARVNDRAWGPAVARHVVRKAKAMGALLSVQDGRDIQALDEVAAGSVTRRSDTLVLRPSNGVVEASDYLGDHDWLQLGEEVVGPFRRVVYDPTA